MAHQLLWPSKSPGNPNTVFNVFSSFICLHSAIRKLKAEASLITLKNAHGSATFTLMKRQAEVSDLYENLYRLLQTAKIDHDKHAIAAPQ
jgi:hypothetical protein